jgi:hypothetical protein
MLNKIKNLEIIKFNDLMEYIDNNYNYQNTAFKNGNIFNKIDENQGSGKVFYFASENNLTKEQTLFCFGEHYQDVLSDKDGDSHQNIRNFMEFGWSGIDFNTKF